MINNCLQIYLLVASCIVIPNNVGCANILLLSHTFQGFVNQISIIGDTLAGRGHNVYMILPETSKFDSYSTMRNIKTLKFKVKKNDIFMDSKEFLDALYGHIFENDVTENK